MIKNIKRNFFVICNFINNHYSKMPPKTNYASQLHKTFQRKVRQQSKKNSNNFILIYLNPVLLHSYYFGFIPLKISQLAFIFFSNYYSNQ